MNLFPNAIYRFVYHNWDLLPARTLARFLGCKTHSVHRMGNDLGLPRMEPPPLERILPVIVRRNWHLMPRKEIARLVGMRMDRFVHALQEIDMLEIKLGKAPSVRKIRWQEPTSAARAAARRLAAKLQPYLADADGWDPPFSFVRPMSRAPRGRRAPKADRTGFNPCLFYSYISTHGDFLLTGEDPYPNGTLARLADCGVNAVWLPGLLRDLSPSRPFAGFGANHGTRIACLRGIVRRAKKHGIEVFLYLNEPRGMPKRFFERHPDARGMPSRIALTDSWGMCTSAASVQDFLRESTAFLFKAIPDLGGAVLITASEYVTNCYSHYYSDNFGSPTSKMCSRCKTRGPVAALTDTARLMQEGLDSIGSKARLLQWLWTWNAVLNESQIGEAIRALPDGMPVVIDWARGAPFEVFGKSAIVDEYSIAHVSPSPMCREHMREARRGGRQVIARAQVVTSVEMNPQPYLPAIPNIARLMRELRRHHVDGLFGSWIFGSWHERNMEILALDRETDDPVKALALKYYGERGAILAGRAWQQFSKALACLPESQDVLYFGPINSGVALPLRLEKESWRHSMVLLSSDHLDLCCKPFGARVVARAFRAAAEHWEKGVELLEQAMARAPKKHHAANRLDHGVSSACGLHYRSAAHHVEFMRLRDEALAGARPWSKVSRRMMKILDDEARVAERLIPIAAHDARIGFEGSVGYYYRPLELIEKRLTLDATRATLKKLAAGGSSRSGIRG